MINQKKLDNIDLRSMILVAFLLIGFIGGLFVFQENNNLIQENNNLNTKNQTLQRNTIDCYWAVEFLTTPEQTTKHFGQDYTQEYVINCLTQTTENWEKLWE